MNKKKAEVELRKLSPADLEWLAFEINRVRVERLGTISNKQAVMSLLDSTEDTFFKHHGSQFET